MKFYGSEGDCGALARAQDLAHDGMVYRHYLARRIGKKSNAKGVVFRRTIWSVGSVRSLIRIRN